jgi:hypothetical protein
MAASARQTPWKALTRTFPQSSQSQGATLSIIAPGRSCHCTSRSRSRAPRSKALSHQSASDLLLTPERQTYFTLFETPNMPSQQATLEDGPSHDDAFHITAVENHTPTCYPTNYTYTVS